MSCGTTLSRPSPASRSETIAGTTLSRKYFACFSAPPSPSCSSSCCSLSVLALNSSVRATTPSSVYFPTFEVPPAAFTADTLLATAA